MIQKHKDKAFEQLTAQMNEALKIEDDRLARGAAEVEVEYKMKNKEQEIKKKAAIESIKEHRATVVRNVGYPCSLFCHILVHRNSVWECHSFYGTVSMAQSSGLTHTCRFSPAAPHLSSRVLELNPYEKCKQNMW